MLVGISYDIFTEYFLPKISEFEFLKLNVPERIDIIDGYMKRSLYAFQKVCKYDFLHNTDDGSRIFNIDVSEADLIEIADIVSEGMVWHWLKPYANQQELMELILNTRDFSTYSPAELLKQVGSACTKAQHNFVQMIREYSYNHGNLAELHL